MRIPVKKGSGAGKNKNKPSPKYTNIPREGAIVTFEVMFDPGFEWGCKGKVGGLSIGTGASSGCDHSTNGASLRMMWDGDQGSVATPFAYVYVPTGSEQGQPVEALQNKPRCGHDLFQQKYKGKMSAGNWYTIELGVKLNTPGKYDGQLRFSFDGDATVLPGVLWRFSKEKIERMHFNVFHGGPCTAKENSSMQIRNVRVRPW